MRPGRFLIFVHTCDRGNLSALKDYSQKLSAEKAPECHLLSLISTPVGIKKVWKRFIQELRIPARFVYRDEYEEEFGELLTTLPAVFLHEQKSRSLFIPAEDLVRAGTVEELIGLVDQRVASLK